MIQIQLSNLDLSFQNKGSYRRLFRELNLDLSIPFGEILGLMGESGSGKSTLLRVIAGVMPFSAGIMTVEGISNGDIAFLPQGGVLFEHLSMADNLRLFARLKVTRTRFDESRLQRAITALDLDALLRRGAPVDKLSGGERQRISLARVLSIQPKLVLLDEPCAAIGGDHRTEFLSILKRSSQELGFSVILASHDWNDHLIVANQVAFIKNTDGLGLSSLPLVSVCKFASMPWHREAISYTSGGPINWIKASETGNAWRLAIGGASLGNAQVELSKAVQDQATSNQPILLACGPDNFQPSARPADHPITFIGASDSYSFLRIKDAVLIVPRAIASAPTSIQIRGTVPAFYESGEFAGFVNLS